ncbi:MAG: hypothetical protein WAP74_04540 [Patescibacteria group bacterium]
MEDIEQGIYRQKNIIFSLNHFDSPHFIDVQNAFDAMEINYLRLKQRFAHVPDQALEIAKDWYRYAKALGDLKHARVMLAVDMDDYAFEISKEPSVVKEEVEKKFKSLLGKDWQKIPLDYFERLEKMKKPDKKTAAKYGIGDGWKYYYQNDGNLFSLELEKQKQEES